MRFTAIITLLLVIPVGAFSETIISGGHVSGTWNAAGSPYLVQGDITVQAATELEIQPGVEVIFQGHYRFTIAGGFQALGTQQDSIIFTPASLANGWFGLRIVDADQAAALEYCRIEYGRANGTGNEDYGGGLYSSNSDITVDHCTFAHNYSGSLGGAIYSGAMSSLTLTNSVLLDNEADPSG